jgi:gamma-glutamylcyclotransferase (GGCT)/AIG2-like uncharacterized protein YtfP
VNLFAYGTLTRRHRMEALVGRRLPEPTAAVLPGFSRHDTAHGYPVILPHAGGTVQGLLWTDVRSEDLSAVDHYEGCDESPPYYFRRAVRVRVGDAWHEAEAYIGNEAVFGGAPES